MTDQAHPLYVLGSLAFLLAGGVVGYAIGWARGRKAGWSEGWDEARAYWLKGAK